MAQVVSNMNNNNKELDAEFPNLSTIDNGVCKSLPRPVLKTVSDEESCSVSGIPWGVSVRKFTVESKQLKAGFPPVLNRYLSKIYFFN